jgi:hypothetical protein
MWLQHVFPLHAASGGRADPTSLATMPARGPLGSFAVEGEPFRTAAAFVSRSVSAAIRASVARLCACHSAAVRSNIAAVALSSGRLESLAANFFAFRSHVLNAAFQSSITDPFAV